MTLRAVAPPLPVGPTWGAYTLSANQTTGLAVGSPIRLDTVMGGNLPISSYTVQLPAEGVFRLAASVLPIFSGGGKLEFSWYNVTAGAYVGIRGYILPPTNGANNGVQPTAYGILTTTQPTPVQLRLAAANLLSSINTASYAEIMQIE
ncbi:MAG TPA: hypothetical protein VGE72_03460 [Azospirillum sp.]